MHEDRPLLSPVDKRGRVRVLFAQHSDRRVVVDRTKCIRSVRTCFNENNNNTDQNTLLLESKRGDAYFLFTAMTLRATEAH